ncbi:hypothetical protein [Gemmiger sp.]
MNIIEKQIPMTLCEEPISLAYEEVPALDAQDYKARLANLWALPQAADLDAIVVYGDREHFSNIHYLTGYDPRWEESLLILTRGKTPVLLVGNEGLGYTASLRAEVDIQMFQTLSLMGQPNDERSEKLVNIFKNNGIAPDSRVGLIGWKAYDSANFAGLPLVTDVPYYMVKTLEQIVPESQITNVTDLLTDCEYGLKHNVSAKEIIQFEVNGTFVSRGVYNLLKNVRPGMTETEASQLLGFDGEPLNMHPNINFGRNAEIGLMSPMPDSKLEYGMPMGVGYGMRGSLVHKEGLYIRSRAELPAGKEGYIEEFLKPYFASVVRWYEMMRIGTPCGEIYDMVEETLGMEKFGITLNPGHMEHSDEWTNSPFKKGSTVKLRSGMMFQCDYSVSFAEPKMAAHVEDGLVLAGAALTEEIRRLSPTCYARIMARKKFIREQLNIDLPEEVLPMSDLTLVCCPYMADISVMLAKGE